MTDPRIAALTAAGAPTLEHIDLDTLDGFRFADGAGFPPSYRAFIRHVGWARIYGLWLIYPPTHPGFADGLMGRGGRLTRRFHDEYAEAREQDFDDVIEPDGDWALAQRLQVFAWSENGDLLLWDPTERDGDGEFPVWESARMQSLHYRGTSLGEVLDGLRTRAGGLAQDASFAPLPAARI
ncbi:hypothetical protein ACWGJP_14805 [Microbacterium sp. NPDC055903]